MVTAQAKFTVSVYANASNQTPGLPNSAIAGGTQGSYGYYPPISSVTGPSSAVTGPGGLPTSAGPYHGLGHMTNIQVPATIFPNSNFTIIGVFTYGGADVANYSIRCTFPGLGIQNSVSQSASVTGGGAATVQHTMATPAVLPYGQIPGTVELIRNGGVIVVDDVQPVTINSPGGVGISGTIGVPPNPFPIPPQPIPIPPGPSPYPPPPVPIPPGPPVPPPTTVVVNVTRSANGSWATLVMTGTGFAPTEKVLVTLQLANMQYYYDRASAYETASVQGQVMHTYITNARSTVPPGSIAGNVTMKGQTTGRQGIKAFTL